MKKHIFFLAGIFSCTFASAQNWTGAVNADWNNAANWSQAPSSGDNITIDPANYTGAMAQPVISSNSVFSPAEMLIQNGGKLTISANLSASDRCEILGAGSELTITNGTFAVNGPGNNARIVFAEGALFTMDGGTFTVGQRLLFELGGSGIINGGTTTVAQTLAIVDGSAAEPSNLLLNGGTLIANGEFGFENEAGNFFPSFTQTGGTLSIDGDLVWLGAAPGSGRGTFNLLGGTATVTGTILNDPASTMNMTLRISGANAFFNMTGTAVSQLAGDSLIVSDNANLINVNSLAWNNGGVVHCTTGGLFRTGNTTLSGTGSYQFCNLEIPAGKSLVHLQPAQLSVSGNIASDGSFVHNSNKLIINGTSAQVIDLNNAGVYDVEFSNLQSGANYGVEITGNLNVTHELKMTAGLVDVAAGLQIGAGQNATITGGSETAFIHGYVAKTGNAEVTFPLGSWPAVYRPLTISGLTSAATVITAAYRYAGFETLNPVEAPLQAVSAIEYWDVSRTGSADLYLVTVGWNDAAQSGLSNCNDITLSVFDGDEWKFVPSTTSGLCEGENAGTLISAAALPAAGPLTIGFTGNVFQQVVTICHTDSLVVGDTVYFDEGVYIDVLQGTNGDSTVVSVLHVVQPLNPQLVNSGTSLSVLPTNAVAYQWVDCNAGFAEIAGATASDFSPLENGTYAVVVYQEFCTAGDTSACETIAILGTTEHTGLDFRLYPNPVNGENSVVIQSAMAISAVTFFSAEGKKILSLTPEKGQQTVSVSTARLSPGVYLAEVQAGNSRSVKRLVIK